VARGKTFAWTECAKVSSGSDKFFRENYKKERERGIYLYFAEVSNVRIKRSREYRKLQIEWIRLSILL